MNYIVKNLPRGQAEIKIELTVKEFEPFLKKAAAEISKTVEISGFRPGKADYQVVKNQVGEEKIFQEALEPAIRSTLVEIIKKELLETIGSPKIDIEKSIMPSQAITATDTILVYKATVNLLPKVRLVDYKNIEVKRMPIKVSEDDIEKTILNLRKIEHSEILVNRPAETGDKLEIDFEAFLKEVSLENGQQKKFPIILGEGTFIPEFEKNLIGLKAGEEKEFEIKMPQNYHQKNLANKFVEFKVKILTVYEVKLPDLNDNFARSLGFKNLQELKNKIKENLTNNTEFKEEQRLEGKILDKIVENSQFDDICDLLINTEAKKMMQELKTNISRQGLNFDDYLKTLGKSREEVLLGFVPEAVKRVKVVIAIREISQKENIDISEEDLNKEIKEALKVHKNNPEIQKNLKTDDYRYYLKNILTSRKVIEFLKRVNMEN